MHAIGCIFIVLSIGSTVTAVDPPKACIEPRHRQFDFWIGVWNVTTPDGKLAGTNTITSVLGGCALHETWVGVSGVRGSSYSIFDQSTELWHQTWVDSDGTLLLLDGTFRDGSMRLSGKQRTAEGEALQRVSWTPLEGGRIRQHWEQSTDGGTVWTTVFDGFYGRKE